MEVLLRNDGYAVVLNSCPRKTKLPPLPTGTTYVQASTGCGCFRFIVLLRSDGQVIPVGERFPALDAGLTCSQVSAGSSWVVLLRSDGGAVACRGEAYGEPDDEDEYFGIPDIPTIPALDAGIVYTQVSAGECHVVLLRSDGRAVASGANEDKECDIPRLEEGMSYVQVSAGHRHTVLLRSDGSAVASGSNFYGQCDIPPLDDGKTYIQVAAGDYHTVLLRSDGNAVAIGFNGGFMHIPTLPAGLSYTQVMAGISYILLIRSDGSAVASGNCSPKIPPLAPPQRYLITVGEDLVLQVEAVEERKKLVLICSTMAGEEKLRLDAHRYNGAWSTHQQIARELRVSLQSLKLVLPDGRLLANVCRAHPAATIGDVLPVKRQRLGRVTS